MKESVGAGWMMMLSVGRVVIVKAKAQRVVWGGGCWTKTVETFLYVLMRADTELR